MSSLKLLLDSSRGLKPKSLSVWSKSKLGLGAGGGVTASVRCCCRCIGAGTCCAAAGAVAPLAKPVPGCCGCGCCWKLLLPGCGGLDTIGTPPGVTLGTSDDGDDADGDVRPLFLRSLCISLLLVPLLLPTLGAGAAADTPGTAFTALTRPDNGLF